MTAYPQIRAAGAPAEYPPADCAQVGIRAKPIQLLTKAKSRPVLPGGFFVSRIKQDQIVIRRRRSAATTIRRAGAGCRWQAREPVARGQGPPEPATIQAGYG
jgi:hypothetical protein